MKTFEQKLNQFISDNAMEYSKNLSDGEYNPKKYRYSIHGAESLKPIVLKLYEACKDYEHMGVPSNGSSLSRHSSAAEALAQVEQMIGGGK